MSHTTRTGVLLLHTGSPGTFEARDVRDYLKRFLMDPRVLRMPFPVRALLVHGVIAPFRARKSAAKYRSIWMEEGAPLCVLTRRFQEALQRALPESPVTSGSAYGEPGVGAALNLLVGKGVERIVVFPMFPHFAEATRGSLLATLRVALEVLPSAPEIVVVPPFHDHPAYIAAFTAVAAPLLDQFRPDHVVFSYHGLPLRMANAAPSDGTALNYAQQCQATTQVLAQTLALRDHHWSLAYQSRFGWGWLKPSIEEVLDSLAEAGCCRVAVMAPSFVTDCLETLEELKIQARKHFLERGGDAFLFVPALNDEPAWVRAVAMIIRGT